MDLPVDLHLPPAMQVQEPQAARGNLPEPSVGSEYCASASRIDATPVVFGRCFGWLHPGAGRQSGEVAILICPALERDALDSHHSLRLLADALAVCGYPVMRFDYRGTGDSDDLGDEEPWSAWQRSVDDAANWLRNATGASRLVMGGLRIGATLAALAAQRRSDVAGLLLLAPVLRGRSYLRQLAVQAQLDQSAAADTLDFHELHLSAASRVLIEGADLQSIQMASGLPIAVFARSRSKLLDRCETEWRRGGASVTPGDFSGLEPMLAHNMVEAVEHPDFTRVTAWLKSTIPPRPAGPLNPPARAMLDAERWAEQPLRFGGPLGLFGVLCCPKGTMAHSTSADLVVLIGNAGRDPRFGMGRFAVEFARRLSTMGIASLRMDFTGLGDSAAEGDHAGPPGHIFTTDRRAEISAGLDVLAKLGFQRFAFQGLCSAAYHGLHAAIADARLSALLLVNIPTFEWRPGDTISFLYRTAAPSRYVTRLLEPATLRRLVLGEIHLRSLAAAQLRRQWEQTCSLRRRIAGFLSARTRETFAQRTMAALSSRGVRTLFLFGPDDHGLQPFMQELGFRLRDKTDSNVAVQVVPGMDHWMSRLPARHFAMDRMSRFLTHGCQPLG